MEKFLGKCGLNCSTCDAYIATQTDDHEMRVRLAEAWSKEYHSDIKPEDIRCDGCNSTSDRKLGYCGMCEIRACGTEHQVEHCGQCSDFQCEKISKFFDMAAVAKENILEETN